MPTRGRATDGLESPPSPGSPWTQPCLKHPRSPHTSASTFTQRQLLPGAALARATQHRVGPISEPQQLCYFEGNLRPRLSLALLPFTLRNSGRPGPEARGAPDRGSCGRRKGCHSPHLRQHLRWAGGLLLLLPLLLSRSLQRAGGFWGRQSWERAAQGQGSGGVTQGQPVSLARQGSACFTCLSSWLTFSSEAEPLAPESSTHLSPCGG